MASELMEVAVVVESYKRFTAVLGWSLNYLTSRGSTEWVLEELGLTDQIIIPVSHTLGLTNQIIIPVIHTLGLTNRIINPVSHTLGLTNQIIVPV